MDKDLSELITSASVLVVLIRDLRYWHTRLADAKGSAEVVKCGEAVRFKEKLLDEHLDRLYMDYLAMRG